MINSVVLMGRLTAAPECKKTQSGISVTSFSIAVDRNYRREDKQTDFINIVVWNKQGESCSQYLSKGKLAAVEGRLQIRNYDDRDGNKRYVTEVIADSVRFLSPKGESGAALGGGFGDAPMDFGIPSTDDDLPF